MPARTPPSLWRCVSQRNTWTNHFMSRCAVEKFATSPRRRSEPGRGRAGFKDDVPMAQSRDIEAPIKLRPPTRATSAPAKA
ncbi:hypothetical protein EWW49_27730, partial [Pseudomonas syringae]